MTFAVMQRGEKMDDLISRQDVLLRIDNAISQENRGWVLHELKTLRMCVEHMPSAQPEIIRCKDCAKRKYCRTSTVWAVPPKDNWYCADAEKRRA